MATRTRSGFALPFTLGTLFGAMAGMTLGALLGHRVFAGILNVWSLFSRQDDDEPRFDLLLQ